VLSVEDYELLGGERLRLLKRSELLELKRQALLDELQQGIDDLDNGRSKEATPEFWSNIKESITR